MDGVSSLDKELQAVNVTERGRHSFLQEEAPTQAF